jgi:hypothetical protein
VLYAAVDFAEIGKEGITEGFVAVLASEHEGAFVGGETQAAGGAFGLDLGGGRGFGDFAGLLGLFRLEEVGDEGVESSGVGEFFLIGANFGGTGLAEVEFSDLAFDDPREFDSGGILPASDTFNQLVTLLGGENPLSEVH